MIGGDARREVGLEIGTAQAAGVAFNQLAAVETGLNNLLHPGAAVEHTVHVHHFRHAAHFRPCQHGRHLRSGKIGAGHFQPRRRGYAGGGGDAFAVQGTPLAKDSTVLDAGIAARLSPRVLLEIGYSGQWSGQARDDAANARLSVQF